MQLGDTVVVMGGGFAGQIIAQCAKKKGAERVIVVDVLEGKLQLARKLGADYTINAAQTDPVAVIREITKGLGADVVVEAAGSEKSINQATALLKHNGIRLDDIAQAFDLVDKDDAAIKVVLRP
ncbi:MAG: L-iditol 2-dehydrogenase [Peptococcaceae bacterium]|nr:L-iditol 2-dehydrogenase [Peptococcaceae bacterium]